MATKVKLSATLRNNMRNWVDDRVDNREGLKLREFFSFMHDLEFEIGKKEKAAITKILTAAYKKRRR